VRSAIKIESPAIDWSVSGEPYSRRFGDVYFSTEDGLAESRHVFLDGIGVPGIWAGRDQYSIGEIGFGTGLNFITTWMAWQKTAAPAARLTYVAIEGYPLCSSEMARAFSHFPELAEFSRELVAVYPEPHPGFHMVRPGDGRVSLLLLFGPVETLLPSFSGSMDAWFLDGFSPDKNPEMWSEKVLGLIAGRSAPGSRVATFTSAGVVRRRLEQVGFRMEKRSGFGRKRESLQGAYAGSPPDSVFRPWFDLPKPVPAQARIAVIGAGIAGAAVAHTLRNYPARVTVFDRRPAPALGASGNPLGLLQPRPADPRQSFSRFQTEAFLHALRVFDRLAGQHRIWQGQRGIVSLARDPAFLDRYRRWIGDGILPPAQARILTSDEVQQVCGLDLGEGGVFFPQAGTINPVNVVNALLHGTACQFDTDIAEITNESGIWVLRAADGKVVGDADAVVLGNGVDARSLVPECGIPLHAKRGQISLVRSTGQSRQLRSALSYGGYATPAIDGFHVLGATYQRCPDWQDGHWQTLTDADHLQNLALLQIRSHNLARLFGTETGGGRAALRTTTSDHAPVIGPMFSRLQYRNVYAELHHGKRQSHYPPASELTGLPGLYMVTAFGSRGFALATLAAEILVAQMFGLPIPVEKEIVEAIHPARFLVRSLKRRQDRGIET